MAAKCAYHPQRDAVSGCVNCGRLICLQCQVILEGKTYCKPCAKETWLEKTEAKSEERKDTTEQAVSTEAPKATEGYEVLNARLLSAEETEEGISYLFDKTDCRSLATAVGSFFAAEGYKLEDGTPEDGAYGKGSGARRIIFGGLAQRYKFKVKILPESELVRLNINKGMSGVSGGVMGYQALNKEFALIKAKLAAGKVPKGISSSEAAIAAEVPEVAITKPRVTTKRPISAGILSIIAGLIAIIIGVIVGGLGDLGEIIAVFWPLGVVAIVGGIFAVSRRLWGLSLAGAICSLVIFPLGIPAIILISMSRREFK